MNDGNGVDSTLISGAVATGRFLRPYPFALPVSFILGAASVAGFEPLGWFPLPLIALTGLMAVWTRLATARETALAGFAFGLGLFGVGVSWVYVSLADFGGMPAPIALLATALFCAILSLYPAAVGYLQARIGGSIALRCVLVTPTLWVVAEWLRDAVTGFPWLAFGYAQAPGTPLAGFAPLLGVFGVSLATAMVAGLLASGIPGVANRPDAAGGTKPLSIVAHVIAALIVIASGVALQNQPWTEAAGPPIKVALLQGNVAQNLKFDETVYEDTLKRYRRLALSSDAKLIVWPETAIPHLLDSVDDEYLEGLRKRAAANRADMLIGIPNVDGAGRYFNSVWSFGASRTQSYSKTHLVPFGEFIPAGFSFVLAVLHIPMGEFTRGAEHPVPLAIAGEQVAANICYEDAFGEEIIRQLPQATMLVNVSNVAWFGHSLAPAQHLQISQMRALETGRPMLRATNSGVTAAIDAHGLVIRQLPQFTEAALVTMVQPKRGETPFVRFGNAPALLIAIAMLLGAVLAARRNAKTAKTP